MDDAFDTVKNQRVRAASASGSRFPDRYICPVCQTEVVYASGDYVSPHFRHRRGTDHEECERYCSSFHFAVPLSRHEWEHLDAVLVAETSETSGQPFVLLAVRFRPTYAVDSVTLVSGAASTPYAIHRNIRQQYFRISQAEENYLIKAHLPDGESEPHLIEGFGENAAVFRATDRETVRLPSHRVLKPGGYIIISRALLQPQFHPLLAAKSLATIPGLHAASIKIPDDPSWQVRSNIQSLLGFETAAAFATYAFLEPMAVSELATDCWEVAKNDKVAVLVRLSSHLSPRPTRLLVQRRHSGHILTEYLPLNGTSDIFVVEAEPATDKIDLYRIALADPPRFILEIRRSGQPIEPSCARLSFQFGGQNGRCNFFWASHELSLVLIDVSRGIAQIASIKKPKSIEISVSDYSGRRAVIPNVDAERELTNFLREACFPCMLFATGYPTLILRRDRIPSRQLRTRDSHAALAPRSRREARLSDAFTRGVVSRYAIRSLYND